MKLIASKSGRFIAAALALGMVTTIALAQPTGTLTGHVLSASGHPVPGAEVAFEPAAGGEIRTDGQGGFTVTGLAPGRYRLTVQAEGFGPQSAEVTIVADAESSLRLTLPPLVAALDEISVTSSFSINREDPVSAVALSQEELLELPHFGNDLYRALAYLPGVSGNDTTAQVHVRGGLQRDLLLELDGVEIFEPYHLKDYQGVFSIIDPNMLGEVELKTGGFPSEYGDRMAGVLDMSTLRPRPPRAYELGISMTGMWASGTGTFGDQKGSWLASARRGYLDLILDFVGPEDEVDQTREGSGPQYWDFLSKVSYEPRPGHLLAFHALASNDALDEEEREIEDGYPEYELWDTSYGNHYFWINHQATLGNRTLVGTTASIGRVDRDRLARGEGFGFNIEIDDDRQVDIAALRQQWSFQPSDRHYLKGGLEFHQYDAEYDYRNDLAPEDAGAGIHAFAGKFSGNHYGLYLADRFRLSDRLTAEVGVRYDDHELTSESHGSPRFNLVYAARGDALFRLGWGHFYQSQRPHELQVEDGETTFLPAERAEHRLLGFEKTFSTRKSTYSLRLDAYQRVMTDLRPRYENLFDPLPLYPETSDDRIRLDPDDGLAQGVELYLARRGGRKFDWWLSYTYATVDDTIDGVDVPRNIDQRHSFTFDLSYRPNKKWSLNAAWIYHSGWPTTAVSGEVVAGPDGGTTIRPVYGPLYEEQLADYHRLDLRAGRTVELKKRGMIEFFIDVQNLYDRANAAGYEVDERRFEVTPGGEVIYTPKEDSWLGIIPSFGVRWRF